MANKVGYIIQLQDRFSRIAKKIKLATGSMKTSIKKLNVSLAKMRKKTLAAAKGMAKMGAAATVTATVPILLLGRAMVNAASDAVETASKFDQVFDDVRDKANRVAKDFAKNFGVASSTSKKLIGDTGDLLVGFGFTGDAALELSLKVNELASDLASFQNLEGGVERASKALTSALLGETESAKSLGIVIRQNDPAFKAQVLALRRSLGVTEMQAKALTILNVATKQSTKAIGDVKRTWNDYASVVRRADEKTKQLKESFGTLLLPIATRLTVKLTALVNWVNNLSPPMKSLILVLGGLVAIGGPLLLVLAGIAFAFSVITLPILAIAAAIGLAIAAFVLLQANWVAVSDVIGGTIEQIMINFSILWQQVKDGFQTAVDFIGAKVEAFIAPFLLAKKIISEIFGGLFGDGDSLSIEVKTVPTTASRSQTDVNINLRAPENTIESVKTRTSGKASGLNMGINMEVAG